MDTNTTTVYTERELDLMEALRHALLLLCKSAPADGDFNKQWLQYHLFRATQGMIQKDADLLGAAWDNSLASESEDVELAEAVEQYGL